MTRFSRVFCFATTCAVFAACHDPIANGERDGAVARPDASVVFGYFFANPVDGGNIYGVPSGGGLPVVLTSGDGTHDIGEVFTFDDQTLYFGSEDIPNAPSGSITYSLHALPIAGGPSVTLASGLGQLVALAVDAHALYFLDQSTSTVEDDAGLITPHGAVERISLAAADPSPQVLATVAASLGGIAVDANYVYWTVSTPSSPRSSVPMGSIWRLPLAGGASESLATSQLNPGPIVVDAGTLFWLNDGTMQVDCTPPDGALLMLPAGSDSPTTVSSALHGARSLAARNGAVYWSTLGPFCNSGGDKSGSVFKFAPAVGTTATVASGISHPDNLYVGATDVYFTTLVDELNDILAATSLPR